MRSNTFYQTLLQHFGVIEVKVLLVEKDIRYIAFENERGNYTASALTSFAKSIPPDLAGIQTANKPISEFLNTFNYEIMKGSNNWIFYSENAIRYGSIYKLTAKRNNSDFYIGDVLEFYNESVLKVIDYDKRFAEQLECVIGNYNVTIQNVETLFRITEEE